MEINTSIEIKLDNILKILTANNDNLSNLNISEHKVMNILSNS